MTWALSGKTPRCDICMPQILPENAQAWEMFNIVCNQHIMGFSGPIDLNYASLEFALKMKQIPEKEWSALFDKVHLAYQHYLKSVIDKSEEGSEK
jgi:hypothetical protein